LIFQLCRSVDSFYKNVQLKTPKCSLKFFVLAGNSRCLWIGTAIDISKETTKEFDMLYTTGCTAMALLAGGLVAAIFFCNVAVAPMVARRVSRSARFGSKDAEKRLLRIW